MMHPVLSILTSSVCWLTGSLYLAMSLCRKAQSRKMVVLLFPKLSGSTQRLSRILAEERKTDSGRQEGVYNWYNRFAS